MDVLNQQVTIFALETTELGFEAGIVEVAYATFTLQSLIDGELPLIDSFLVKPERPISQASYSIHGISNQMVEGQPTILEFWELGLSEIFRTSQIISGYNHQRFDVPILESKVGVGALTRDKSQLDVMKVYRRLTGNRKGTLSEACSMFNVPHESQYRAAGDVQATIILLMALINHFGIEKVLGIEKIPSTFIEKARLYKSLKTQIADLENQLEVLRAELLTSEEVSNSNGEVTTPYLKIEPTLGRKRIDYKRLVDDLNLNELEKSNYTVTGEPGFSIRVI